MGIIYTYTDEIYGSTINVYDTYMCDENETYKDPEGDGILFPDILGDDNICKFGTTDVGIVSFAGTPSATGRSAILLTDEISGTSVDYITMYPQRGFNLSTGSFVYNDQQQVPLYFSQQQQYQNTCGIATNVPIFKKEDAQYFYEYLSNNITDTRAKLLIKTYAINMEDKAFEPTTKDYYIENLKGMADCVRNTATSTGAQTWRSMRFQTNSKPVLYYGADYSLTLSASNVVASASVAGPLSIVDMLPQSQWLDGELAYTGPWYGSIVERMKATGETLPDGSYMYGFSLNTNIYVFENEEKAKQAQQTDDYSEAINYDQVTGGGGYKPPELGTDEEVNGTQFGGGADTSPFVSTYVLGRNAVLQVANKWYTDDPDTWQDILTGISMTGDKPYEAIAGLTLYPFDVNVFVNTSPQTHIYFGSYQMELTGTTVYKVGSMKASAYLDAGTVFLADRMHSFRSYEPYSQLDVYLPYIGWERLDISKLINKFVNVRYYVDIHTRACTACILAGSGSGHMVLMYQFSGTIGVGLPVTSSDFQGYANAMGSTILSGGGNIAQSAGGAITGALGVVGGAGIGQSLLTSVGGIVGTAVNMAGMLNKLEKVGQPQDYATTKGTFTSGIGTYMPQYVIFRFMEHETIEPDNYVAMCGMPSNASGYLSSFSGFISTKSVQLNTSGMLDSEAGEILSLLKAGIYI